MDPYRQARSKEDYERCARLAEIEAWERQRRRELLKAYAKAAVQIVALLALVVVVTIVIVGALNEL